MKIALIGYGAMGKLIETLAENKNHEIALIIDESDANLSADKLAEKLKGVDAAIDFSVAEAVKRNVEVFDCRRCACRRNDGLERRKGNYQKFSRREKRSVRLRREFFNRR